MSSEDDYFVALGPVPGDDGAQAAFYTFGANIRTGAYIVGIDAGVIASSDKGVGVAGFGSKDQPGVEGIGNPGVSGGATDSGHGVEGGATAVGAAGVRGVNPGFINNGGVAFGGVGVRGEATYGDGVQGFTSASNRSGSAGVNQAAGVGTFGFSANGDGMLAYSGGAGHGLVAHSTQGIGVYASTSNLQSVAIAGVAPANGTAGVFEGRLAVIGPLVVFGAKSAAVPHADGSHRLLYSIESPESWFEDFGEASLLDGKCTVQLDADFISVVKSGHYHVFISAYSDSRGLYVSHRGRHSFDVRERDGGTGNAAFSYRIVAKRRDIAGDRFATVSRPDIVAPHFLERPVLHTSASDPLTRRPVPPLKPRP